MKKTFPKASKLFDCYYPSPVGTFSVFFAIDLLCSYRYKNTHVQESVSNSQKLNHHSNKKFKFNGRFDLIQTHRSSSAYKYG